MRSKRSQPIIIYKRRVKEPPPAPPEKAKGPTISPRKTIREKAGVRWQPMTQFIDAHLPKMPYEIRIDKDLCEIMRKRWHSASNVMLTKVVRFYLAKKCRRPNYLKSLLTSPIRYGINGEPGRAVTDDNRRIAQIAMNAHIEKIEAIREKTRQRVERWQQIKLERKARKLAKREAREKAEREKADVTRTKDPGRAAEQKPKPVDRRKIHKPPAPRHKGRSV